MLRLMTSVLALLFLVACTADHKWASDADVARYTYVDPGPASITLMTSINTRSKAGAHSAILINGSQRVLYDPAGSWEQPTAPERNDLKYGITPQLLANYVDFQGTAPFEHVHQTILVSPEVAEMAIQAAMRQGSTEKAQCTRAVGNILRSLPGFEDLPTTLFPKQLSKAFAKLPGVRTQTLTNLDGDRRRSIPDGQGFATLEPQG